MNELNITIQQAKPNYFFLANNKLLKTKYNNIIKVNNINIAYKLTKELKKYKTEKSFFNSNLIKLLYFSHDLDRKEIFRFLFKYLDTDTLCYRAIKNSELEKKQKRLWDPLIKYVWTKFKIKLKTQFGIMPLRQELSSKKYFLRTLHKLSPFSLCCFYFITKTTNSVIIALNVLEGNIEVKKVLSLSLVEENYNMQKWGFIKERKKMIEERKLFLDDVIKFHEIFKG